MKAHTAADRVRARLKEELHARKISQRDLAEKLSRETDEHWTQSKVGKVLNGDVELKVDDAEAIARLAGIYLSEAVRDRGLEFYAEMSPTELRLLERIRQEPHTLHGVMMLLQIPPPPVNVTATTPKRGRPLHSESKKRAAP